MNKNIDLDALINQALDEGLSPDEIGKRVSDALNKRKEQEEKKNSREASIKNLKERVHEHYTKGEVYLADTAALTAVIFAEEHPEWTGKEISECYDSIYESLNLMRKMLNGEDVIGAALEKIDNKLNQFLGLPNKRKDKDKVTARPVGSSKKDDWEVIRDFINKL